VNRLAKPSRSRQLLAQSPVALWRSGPLDDEGRSYLQTRMTLYSRLMLFSIVALLVFLTAMYWIYPAFEPRHNSVILLEGTIGLGVMAILWRGVLLRRVVSVKGLYALDVIYAAGIGGELGSAALLASDLRPSGYTVMIYAAFTVFMRAIVVPSSGRRTAVVSLLVFVPIWIAAVILGFETTQELPGPAFVVGALVLGVVPILLASVGSNTIYGLRREVSKAKRLGQYTLDGKIGEGGNGEVYRARHELLRRPTAIKLLAPDRVGADNLKRFEREVQHMSQLTHPNTVAVFDYGRSPDGVFYYAMEYLDGINLQHLIERFGPQPSGRVVHILVQVCGALHEAHAAGLIHRDIKPANIILCERGAVPDVAKVVDFGLVKEITRDTGAPTDVVLGTPAYISPEAVTRPDHITPAADLYALGAVGYFLITGRPVFDGATPDDVCRQHVRQPPRPPSDLGAAIPPALEEVLMKCLAKQPAQRYPSAAALADALEAVPAADDWRKADAIAWWERFRASETAATATSAAPTLTITVDLGARRV
jgi:eukaryotic-like serine/threonine-protein kinase